MLVKTEVMMDQLGFLFQNETVSMLDHLVVLYLTARQQDDNREVIV